MDVVTRKGEFAVQRKPRADAERNRLALLAAAKTVFAEKGATASLDEIARMAGVGAGTLYRHFPTRDALVEALYRNETDQLIAAGALLARTQPPVQALREWLLLFVDFIATKHGIYELLNAIGRGTSELYSATSAKITQAVTFLVARAAESGEIRLDLDPHALLRACAGVANINAGPDGKREAKRLVDILIAGIRTQAQ